MDWGLREWVNLGLIVPFRNSRATGRIEADVDGLGDIGLSGRFALTDPDRSAWKVAALGLVSLPTGEVEDDPARLEENVVLGVGAISLGGAVEAIHDWPRAGSLYFRAMGVEPTGTSDEGVRFGGSLSILSGFGRPFVTAGRSRWAVSAAIGWTEVDRTEGEEIESRGGRQATVTGGLLFPLAKELDISLGAQRLVDVDLHGDQLAARWSGFLGLRWLWDTGSPIRRPPVNRVDVS